MATPEERLKFYDSVASKFESDPALREKYWLLYKEAFPQATIPVDITAKKEILAVQEKEKEDQKKRFDELEHKLLKKEFEDKFEKDRQLLSGPPWFLGDQQIKLVDELVEKKGFPSLELAADYLRATSEPLKPSGLGLSGFTPSKTTRDERKEFNKRYQNVFKKRPSKFNEVFDDAYTKAFVTGEYLKEMGNQR